MIEQLVFVACLTLYIYLSSDNDQLFAEKTQRHVENETMMFNHALNACPFHRCVLCKITKDIRNASLLDNTYLPFLCLLAQAVIFTMH